jgi:DNA repair protein RadD
MQVLELRPYQVEDVERLRAAYAKGNRAVLYCLPTGGGKTVVFAHVIASAVGRGRRTGVLVHRRELVRQASDKLAAAGVAHGIVAAGLDRDHDAPVLVMSVQTAARRLDRLPKLDFIVADEAHHTVAESWSQLLRLWSTAKLLGVTATPARLDGRGLGVSAGGLFNHLEMGATVAELQAEGFLAKTRVFVPARLIDTSGLHHRAGDFQIEELAARAGEVTGDAVKEYRERADHQPAIAYGCTVAHAEAIANSFRAAGYRSACVHGKSPKDERDGLIGGLATGEIEVLTSCDLISEGLDVPSVGAVILLRPTESLALAMQQIGRGMRPADGKEHLTVLDHAGNCVKHGLPNSERQWSLDGEPKTKAGHTPSWRCEECGRLNEDMASTICEDCGAARPRPAVRRLPEPIRGELNEVTAEQLKRVAGMRYRELMAVPRSEMELRAYARAHGYKAGWVWHRLMEQARWT